MWQTVIYGCGNMIKTRVAGAWKDVSIYKRRDGAVWTDVDIGRRLYIEPPDPDPFWADVVGLIDLNKNFTFYPTFRTSQSTITAAHTLLAADDYCLEAHIDRLASTANELISHSYTTGQVTSSSSGTITVLGQVLSTGGFSFNGLTEPFIHIAFVKTSGVIKFFVNGAQLYSAAYTGGDKTFASGTAIAANFTTRNLRLTLGTTPYTAAFTPPDWKVPLAPISNTIVNLECLTYNDSIIELPYDSAAPSRVYSGTQWRGAYVGRKGESYITPYGWYASFNETTFSSRALASATALTGNVFYTTFTSTPTPNQAQNLNTLMGGSFTQSYAGRAMVLEGYLEFTNTNTTGNQDLGSFTFRRSTNQNAGGMTLRANHDIDGQVTLQLTTNDGVTTTVPTKIAYNTLAHIVLMYNSAGVQVAVNSIVHNHGTYTPSLTDYVKVEYSHMIPVWGKANYLRMTKSNRYATDFSSAAIPYGEA